MSTYDTLLSMARQGEIVELRTMPSAEAAVLKALLAHPEVKPHILLRQGEGSPQAHLDKLVARMLHACDPCALHAGIYAKGRQELIGTVSLQNWSRREGKAVLGYMLNPLWWGQGMATEAVGLLLDYAIQELGLIKAEGRCRSDNPRSERVMIKNGLTLERILPMPGSPGTAMKVFTLLHK
ncbi:GNAT family N-acetyltransferase [Paenibacillus sp. S150]|uniref:GNAT family N-acetyltransferase n=1 Tax=Paenibacillus sp. S150 TaxID=2749826 RepID=UPI001C58A9D1|nr:GNAT family N-acetyltransferase [Paenibacillus sp. S150]MBW4081018.1 GNAT family N-acetyltransferase [Paenibacillus sp. S150]